MTISLFLLSSVTVMKKKNQQKTKQSEEKWNFSQTYRHSQTPTDCGCSSCLKPIPDTSNWPVFIQEPRRAECTQGCFHMGLTQVQIPISQRKAQNSHCIIWQKLAPAGLFTQSDCSDLTQCFWAAGLLAGNGFEGATRIISNINYAIIHQLWSEYHGSL